jgi:chromate transporter
MMTLAAAAFFAIFFFQVPFPWIVVSTGLAGFLGGKLRPDLFVVLRGHAAATSKASEFVISDDLPLPPPTLGRTIRVASLWLVIWLVPVALVAAATGPRSIFTTEAIFFSKAATVTFGGAYAVLAYIAQEGVHTYGWLKPGEMLDGLAMAETTPGPLIQVVQFVGFLGA